MATAPTAVVTPTSRPERRAGELSPQASAFDATQISEAIAKGFAPVLKSVQAMQREVEVLTQTMSRSADVAARRLEQASRMYAGQGGLRSPSGMSQADAARAAVEARGVAEAAGNYTPSRRVPIAPPLPRSPVTRTSDGPGVQPQSLNEAYANSMQTLRSSVASRVAEGAQNWAGKSGIMQDPMNPNVYYYSDPQLVFNDGMKRWTRNGRIVSEAEMQSRRVLTTPGYKPTTNGRWINEATGKFASRDEVARATQGWDKVSEFQSRNRVAGGLVDAASAWSKGEPIGRALLSAFPTRTAAMIGTGAGIATAAYRGVRQAAAMSQQLYGQGQAISQYTGGSALEGFGESLRDRFGSWQQGFNFFGPGGEDYTALAGQANQMGMRGSRKNNFVNYGLDLQGDLKMGSEETIRIMSSIVRAGDSLMNLDTALRSVTQSAREAGMSTADARQQFTENYDAIRQQWLYSSSQTKSVAAGLTNATLALGEGATGASIDQSARMRANLAGVSGMSISDFSLKARNDPQWGIGVQEDFAKRMLNTGAGGQMSFGDAVSAFMQENPSFAFDRQGDRNRLIDYLYGLGFNEVMVQPLLAQAGISVPQTEEALIVAASLYTDKKASSQIGAVAKEIDSKYSARSLSEGKGIQEFNVWQSKNRNPLGVKLGQAYASAVGMKDYSFDRGYYGDGKGLTDLPMVRQYISDVTENKIAADGKLIVQTPDGEKTVTAEEAIKYYSDQIQAGTAVIAEGEANGGKSLAELYGVSSKYNPGISGNSATSGPGNVGSGVEKTVTVTLTPEAQRIVALMGVAGTTTSSVPVYWNGTPMDLPGVKVGK